MKKVISLPDRNQAFWQMASIQIAAFGVPSLVFGAQSGRKYGAGTALISICIGNLILWLIGLALVSMTVTGRKNAINNLNDHIGKYGRLVGGLVLSIAFLFWYTVQIKGTMSEMRVVLAPHLNLSGSFAIRLGTFLGLTIALLCVGGIKFIKWFSIVTLPFLLIFIFYAMLRNESYPGLTGTWGVSTPVIFGSAAIALDTTINLPTFFRHRRSVTDAHLALSLFVLFTAAIECLAVFLINSQTGEFFSAFLSHNLASSIIVLLFMVCSLICVNMSNIYFASAAWEAIFPWVNKSKELAIIGMAGTLTFTILQASEIMHYLESIFTGFIGVLGVVVISSYFGKLVVQHRRRTCALFINFLCWVVGCFAVALVQDIGLLQYTGQAFFSGIGFSMLLFTLVLFAEEMVWMLRKISSIQNPK